MGGSGTSLHFVARSEVQGRGGVFTHQPFRALLSDLHLLEQAMNQGSAQAPSAPSSYVEAELRAVVPNRRIGDQISPTSSENVIVTGVASPILQLL